MNISGSGTAEPKFQYDGSRTAGSVTVSGSGTAGSTRELAGTAGLIPSTGGRAQDNSGFSGTAAKQAPYRNFHQGDEPVAGSGNGTIFTTARYKNI